MEENPAVLLLIFNRPGTTARTMAAIRAARPPRLYVAGDGPRRDRPGEAELCEEARRVATSVDWPCQVFTLFRDVNLGCRAAVSGALDWFFQAEDEGIVLEDDCVPAPSFFSFCAALLARYRDDARIMCVTGDNFQSDMSDYAHSYYFSKYNHCWGWASWRRAWRLYDKDMETFDDFSQAQRLSAMSATPGFTAYWLERFKLVKERKIDSWAYVWTYSCWAQNGLTATPRVNLVSNIGFGDDATHTIDGGNDCANKATGALTLPLSHPSIMTPHEGFDAFADSDHFKIAAPAERRALLPHSISASLRRCFARRSSVHDGDGDRVS